MVVLLPWSVNISTSHTFKEEMTTGLSGSIPVIILKLTDVGMSVIQPEIQLKHVNKRDTCLSVAKAKLVSVNQELMDSCISLINWEQSQNLA